jgi:hypothetical protein
VIPRDDARFLIRIGVGGMAQLGNRDLQLGGLGAEAPLRANLGGWEVPGVIPAAAAFVALVALLALLGPARRSVRVDPVEELKGG